MSIVVNLFYEGTSAAIQELRLTMEREHISEEIENFPGNLKHEYFQSINRSNIMLIMNEWQDKASLQAFLESDVMKKVDGIRKSLDIHVSRQAYDESEDLITSEHIHFKRQ